MPEHEQYASETYHPQCLYVISSSRLKKHGCGSFSPQGQVLPSGHGLVYSSDTDFCWGSDCFNMLQPLLLKTSAVHRRFISPLHWMKFHFTMTDTDCTFKANLAISFPPTESTGLLYDSVYLCKRGHVINKSLSRVLHKQITCSALISSTHDFSIKTIPLSLAASHPRARD